MRGSRQEVDLDYNVPGRLHATTRMKRKRKEKKNITTYKYAIMDHPWSIIKILLDSAHVRCLYRAAKYSR